MKRTPAAEARRPAGGGSSSGFDDTDDDIPFVTCDASADVIWKKLNREVSK